MITLYGGPTPNARKVAIALEEMELPWRLELIDILAGDQFRPDFLALNPNNKAPVIVDDEPTDGAGPLVLSESGAILWYLAEKTGRFLPTAPRDRAICHQWLMFQMSGVGPMFGQNAHFSFYAKDKHPYSIERYAREVTRLLRVLDGRLADSPYLAGPNYTIADIAAYPYVLRQVEARRAKLPGMARWSDAAWHGGRSCPQGDHRGRPERPQRRAALDPLRGPAVRRLTDRFPVANKYVEF
jgi:GST-like protein